MFGLILTSITTVMQIYVFGRLATVPFISRHIPKWALIGMAIVLWTVFIAGRALRHNHIGGLSTVLEFVGMNWMAVLFLTFIPLLLVDIVTLFGFLAPRFSITLRGGALIIGLLLSITALIQGLRPPIVENYEVKLADLPDDLDGTVIAVLSDLHLGTLLGSDWLAARIKQVQAEHPDMVVLTGDIFEGHGSDKTILVSVFKQLAAPLGIWAVLGNHEFYGKDSIQLFETAGAKLLRNQWVEIKNGLVLAGIDDLTAMRRRERVVDPMPQALQKRPRGATILLSHIPWQTAEAAQAGVGLMLSGHTHGGQIWPFNYLVQRRYPFLEGRYQVNGMTLIVSRGTGTWGPRMRLWHPGVILRVTLRANHKKD